MPKPPPLTEEEVKLKADLLTYVWFTNPEALPLAIRLLNVQACDKCGYSPNGCKCDEYVPMSFEKMGEFIRSQHDA